MARMTITVPEGLQKLIDKCSDIDRIAPIMLKEAAPHAAEVLWRHVREKHSTAGRMKSVRYVVQNRKSKRYRLVKWTQSGDLADSVYSSTRPKYRKGAWVIDCGFDGYIETASGALVAYDTIANQLEYGNSRQSATPFVDAARAEAAPGVAEIMDKVYRRECGLE